MHSLKRGIEDVNDIYKSLAVIVNSQGGSLDSIAVHVVASVEGIKKAYVYLSPKNCFCIFFVY
jgi:hypothetical protein